MPLTGAVWCVACGAMPDVSITVEQRGVLAHYGACWAHAAQVVERCRAEQQAPTTSPAAHPEAIDVDESPPALQARRGDR